MRVIFHIVYLLSLKEFFVTEILQESRILLSLVNTFAYLCFHAVKGIRLEPS